MKDALNTSDIGYAVKTLIESWLAGNVHTAQPGIVTAVNGDTLDVKPLLNKSLVDGSQLECKPIPGVMNLFGPNASLSVTVSVGDIVLLVFCEESLANFSTSGQAANTTYSTKFDLSNAIAIPLLFTSGTNNLQALMTAAYKSAIESFFFTAKTGELAKIATGIAAGGGSYTPGVFTAPTTSLTSKTKAV